MTCSFVRGNGMQSHLQQYLAWTANAQLLVTILAVAEDDLFAV